MTYPTLLAVCTPAGLLLFSGCAALGLLSGAATMQAQSGNPRSGSPLPLPGALTGAGHSIFEVVSWGMAIVIAALALAFVARLLNGRNRTSTSNSPKPAEPYIHPDARGTGLPNAPSPGPVETDRATRRQPLKDS